MTYSRDGDIVTLTLSFAEYRRLRMLLAFAHDAALGRLAPEVEAELTRLENELAFDPVA